jgi:hypothetical protein
LVQPKCPECGYRFTWPEVLDPALRRHPYLFEHHSRRNVWSFVRTMLAGLRPRRFWSSLKPSQPSTPRRLVLYWLIASSLLPLGYALLFARTAVAGVPQARAARAAAVAYAKRMRQPVPPGHTVPEWVDEHYPEPLSVQYVSNVYRRRYAYDSDLHVRVAVLFLVWPWLTFGVLMIFRVSMRKAKVKTVHVLRCVLYCCDAGLWLGAGAALASPWLMRELDLGRHLGYRVEAVAAPLLAAVTAWRLAAAYRHYLRFEHPAATAIASQLVVTLGVGVFLYAGAG